jgi:HK97 family phage major capsid protein
MTKAVRKETKAATMPQGRDFSKNFAAFKTANDARLAELEQKQSQIETLNKTVSRQTGQIERLTMAASDGRETHLDVKSDSQTRKAWSRYVRSGDQAALQELEGKSLTASDGNGGYIVPVETETVIDSALAEVSPFRNLATIRAVSTANFTKPISSGGAVAGWAGDAETRTETTAPDLDLIEFPAGELYAMPAATQTLLDDSVADVDQWLAEEVQDVFSAQETAAFVLGDGVNKPRGILSYPQAADGSESKGEIGYVPTGVDGDFDAEAPIDALIDLTYAPETRYRRNASFIMNRRTLGRLRKFKDADGNYIWQASNQAGQPSTLLGFPVIEIEDMPDIASGSMPVAFGDFRRGYLIADRQGVRVLRDPYSAKPFVLFYTTKRVGGGIQDFSAIKLLKCSEA